nr:bax inhibitor 1 [Quercus suber]
MLTAANSEHLVETLKLRERTREDRKKGSVRGEDGNQGAYLHFLWHIGGFFTTIACFGSIMWPLSIPVYQEQKKGALLMAAVIFERDSLGPLFDLANVVELAALMYMEIRLAGEHGPDGCYTFGAVGEAEVVNAQGGPCSAGLSLFLVVIENG